MQVSNINDQLDATVTILLIFESAQHVLGLCRRTLDLHPTTTLGQYTTLL